MGIFLFLIFFISNKSHWENSISISFKNAGNSLLQFGGKFKTRWLKRVNYQELIGVNQTARKECSFPKRNLKQPFEDIHKLNSINRLDMKVKKHFHLNSNKAWCCEYISDKTSTPLRSTQLFGLVVVGFFLP